MVADDVIHRQRRFSMSIKTTFRLANLILIAGLVGCGTSPAGVKDFTPNPNITESQSQSTVPGRVFVVTVESGNAMRVLWTVSAYVIGKDSTWSDAEAKALLFQPLDITETEISFGGQACRNVTFQKETVNSADYLSGVWKTTPQALGIEEQELEVFKTDCSLPGFQEYVRLTDSRLIVPINGVFFFFDPAFSQ
jgi:hypothetical protein